MPSVEEERSPIAKYENLLTRALKGKPFELHSMRLPLPEFHVGEAYVDSSGKIPRRPQARRTMLTKTLNEIPQHDATARREKLKEIMELGTEAHEREASQHNAIRS